MMTPPSARRLAPGLVALALLAAAAPGYPQAPDPPYRVQIDQGKDESEERVFLTGELIGENEVGSGESGTRNAVYHDASERRRVPQPLDPPDLGAGVNHSS